MRKFLTAIFVFIFFSAYSQELSRVNFAGGSALSYFTFITDQGVHIRISVEGKILEWGVEMLTRYGYYAPQLQPYMGRIDYYGPESDSIFRGKLRSIGTCSFTYYNSYEKDSKPGKLRSIGTQIIDYYSNFDNPAFRGKIKFAGIYEFQYYTSFEDEPFRGKLKTINNTLIKYYSSFDEKSLRGKIKNIGGVDYQWYTSYDVGYTGGLKSGNYRQNINGITYILQ